MHKNTADLDSYILQKFNSLYKAETLYEGRLKVILLLQVSSHDFEIAYRKVASSIPVYYSILNYFLGATN